MSAKEGRVEKSEGRDILAEMRVIAPEVLGVPQDQLPAAHFLLTPLGRLFLKGAFEELLSDGQFRELLTDFLRSSDAREALRRILLEDLAYDEPVKEAVARAAVQCRGQVVPRPLEEIERDLDHGFED